MAWPFDWTGSTSPPAGFFTSARGYTTTFFSGAWLETTTTTGGDDALLINAGARERFSIVLDIECTSGSRYFGPCAYQSGSSYFNGMIGWNIPYAGSQNVWTGASVLDGTITYHSPISRVTSSPWPVFAMNTRQIHKLEYFRDPVSKIARCIYTVDNVRLMNFSGYVPQGPAQPGLYLYGNTTKLHRATGDDGPNAAEFEFNISAQRTDVYTSIGPISQTVKSSNHRTTKKAYVDRNAIVSGKILGSDFLTKKRRVMAVDRHTMQVLGDTVSDEDGNYTFTQISDLSVIALFVEDAEGHRIQAPTVAYVGEGKLSGTCRVLGVGFANVEVKVYSEETDELLGYVQTDVNGEFTVPNVKPGVDFYLIFRDPAGAWEDRVSSRRTAVPA